MFPDMAQLEFSVSAPSEAVDLGTSFMFDFEAGDFVIADGKPIEIDDVEAIKVWVEKIILTEKLKYQIYKLTPGDEYGINLINLIGTVLPRTFVEAELKREIREALTRHPRIARISNLVTERDGSLVKISFTINLTDDQTLDQEVSISV